MSRGFRRTSFRSISVSERLQDGMVHLLVGYFLVLVLVRLQVLTTYQLLFYLQESIVPEILNLNKMYLPIEENVEDMLCKS
jgi:hypothetical protein